MPAMLAGIVSEPVSLASDHNSPYEPPHETRDFAHASSGLLKIKDLAVNGFDMAKLEIPAPPADDTSVRASKIDSSRPEDKSQPRDANMPSSNDVQKPKSDGSSRYASDGKRMHSLSEPQHIRYGTEPSSRRISSSLPTPSSPLEQAAGASSTSLHLGVPRLHHRHTLEVPRVSASRTSREWIGDMSSEACTPRPSQTLGRAPSRSIHSDLYTDDLLPDEEAARWTETIRQRRASRRKRKEEEEEDRVVVGTKVDVHHVNWVTAYNMLTGIRFTVSRINAKIDRELLDSDFDAKHKFSFDITGNELTPSAKYDFKFKDYAPWVFRHLRNRFQIDPADYLMSLTSKYILSELGSPGKSGSFFYFSRDYKYIIKTIHHAEHKVLRKILREYYSHVVKYPNTLISQFYGLHRVKIPYGRKIHFVVMNNLFPPHRDVHEMFDLKGSTIGRELKEDLTASNPRATLKDLNWLRRQYHFELDPKKKALFVEQMERDVSLLQKLKIMDYSLLVGIHDLSRGNDENLRDKTLQVFQPGADGDGDTKLLTRTPSKMESARQAKQLRQIIKKERPVPMDKAQDKMPDQLLEERRNLVFYGDDGGFRATHDDGSPGEAIYYLGIIDCLTHYGVIKRAEHFWKSISASKSQISPIPPQSYGSRFVRFISGLTMTKAEAERRAARRRTSEDRRSTMIPESSAKSQRKASTGTERGEDESSHADRTLATVKATGDAEQNINTTLPVVIEDREGASREESTKEPEQDHDP